MMIVDDGDTPVWMVYRHDSGQYEPVLVAWYNQPLLEKDRFLTSRTFGTQLEANEWLKEFWQTYWRLAL